MSQAEAVGGPPFIRAAVSATFTRPNNTTAYASGQVVGTTAASILTWTLPSVSRALTSGFTCVVDGANQGTKLNCDLFVWVPNAGGAPPSSYADQDVFAPSLAELQFLFGLFTLGGSPTVANSGAGAAGSVVYSVATTARHTPVTGATYPSLRTLYGILVARNAYTPVANEQFTIFLHCNPLI